MQENTPFLSRCLKCAFQQVELFKFIISLQVCTETYLQTFTVEINLMLVLLEHHWTLTLPLALCFSGQKSLDWTLKRVASLWSWWRTTIRSVSCHENTSLCIETNTQTPVLQQCVLVFFRDGSRSTPLCSSWPAPRVANTCGSAPWRVTPSSGSVSPPRGRPAAATSRASALASGSGRAQRTQTQGDRRWLTRVVVTSRNTSNKGRVCHMTHSLCIYGYCVSMVT